MGNKILAGIPVCGGVVTGQVRVITDSSQVSQVKNGDIMVVPKSHPWYALGVMRASGLICEEGAIICHICTAAKELGIPCITQAQNAVEIMKTKEKVILKADEGGVYDV
jgi:pyruvate,water dikinase